MNNNTSTDKSFPVDLEDPFAVDSEDEIEGQTSSETIDAQIISILREELEELRSAFVTLQKENEALKLAVRVLDPIVYGYLFDPKVEPEMRKKGLNECAKNIWVDHNWVRGRRTGYGDKGPVTKPQVAAIVDRLTSSFGNTPIHIAGIIDPERGRGKNGLLTRDQRKWLTAHLKADPRLKVGKVPLLEARRVSKKHRKDNFVWLATKEPVWSGVKRYFRL